MKDKKQIKRKFKIIKTKEFLRQEKKLPKEVKAKLNKVLKSIVKNPTKTPNSMSIFGKPSPEELKRWMSRTKPETIDLVFEYLHDKKCLSKKGEELAYQFWEKYIKSKKMKGGQLN